jgi:hypothetical protein
MTDADFGALSVGPVACPPRCGSCAFVRNSRDGGLTPSQALIVHPDHQHRTCLLCRRVARMYQFCASAGTSEMQGYGWGPIQNTDRTAPFDIEAAPLAPWINVGRDQSFPMNRLDGTTHRCTCAHASFEILGLAVQPQPTQQDTILWSRPLSSTQVL